MPASDFLNEQPRINRSWRAARQTDDARSRLPSLRPTRRVSLARLIDEHGADTGYPPYAITGLHDAGEFANEVMTLYREGRRRCFNRLPIARSVYDHPSGDADGRNRRSRPENPNSLTR
jgi:hypothetical protein